VLARDWWFSADTPASPTTKIDRHDIAAILLKVALNTNKSNQSNQIVLYLVLNIACVFG
jgi:hypothetical protein